jgi:hypothetical protein
LQGEDIPWRDKVFYEYYWERNFPHTPTVFGLRGDRYKYMFYHGVWDIDEFYDLQNDPLEKNNLIFSPEHQDRIKAMQDELFDLLEATNGMVIPLQRPRGGQQNQRKLH